MNIKKILTTLALCAMGLGILILILGIFGVKIFETPILNILLTLALIAVASTFSISAYSLLAKNKIISIISLCLLSLVSIMGLIIFWANFKTPVMFNKITAIVAIATVLFNIMVSFAVNLGKRQKALQICTYIFTIIIDIILTLLIFEVNVFSVGGILELFLVICLVDFGLICALAILNKKTYSIPQENDDEYIKVKKDEYLALVEKVKELEAQLKENTI